MNKLAIDVEGLERQYNNAKVVNGISFSVEQGEIFGLLGPNGAGKTTTLSMLTGIIRPTCGKIYIQNMDYSKHSTEIKKMIGFVPQHLALYPTISALDNLIFFAGIYQLPRNIINKRIEETLELVGLSERANDVVHTYSGGMKRRLNLAIGLLHEPQILILDEPTVGVDPQSRNTIFEAIERLNRMGVTIIYTTHYMEEAQRLCSKVAIMDNGSIIALDTPSDLCQIIGEGFLQASVLDGNIITLIESLNLEKTIRKVSFKDSVLEIEAHSLQQALILFINLLNKYEVRISSFKVNESSLEAVFLKLTGKKLRD